MARLLLVTRNPALPLALATADIEFDQRQPDVLGDVAGLGPVLVALDPQETDELCRRLAARGCAGVIAAGSDPRVLKGLARDDIAVTITLPLTRDALVTAVNAALKPGTPPQTPTLPEQLEAPSEESAYRPAEADASFRLRELRRLPQVSSAPVVVAHPEAVPAPRSQVLRQARSLVERLQPLSEAVGGVAAQAAHATHSVAAAIFLPDDDIWRVAAGIGLRPLEMRIALTAEDWIVNELARLGHGIIAENSMEARKRLMGVPLASWPQLLAAPVDGVAGLALVARSNALAYTREDLDALVAVLHAAEAALTEALAVRDLARSLEPWRDRPGESSPYST